MILLQMPQFLEAIGQSETGRIFVTFVISMVPLIELRGSIPFGVYLGMRPLAAAGVSAVGTLVPAPFIILFIRHIFGWMKKLGGFPKKLALGLERRAEKKSTALDKGVFLGLVLFIGLPLPGTGVWMSSLIAAMLGLRLKKALPAILLGVFIDAVVITGLTVGFTHLL